MTIRGKSALRKKRLKTLDLGPRRVAVSYSAPAVGWMSTSLRGVLCLRGQLVPQDAYEGEVPVPLGEVEPVPDHEPVGDLEADVAAVDVDLAAGRLREESADLERSGL